MTSHRKQVLAAAVVAVILSGVEVRAQAVNPTPATSAASDDTLEAVIVTAERRSTDLQTTPISMVALSNEQLAEKEVHSLSDVQAIAPNVTINNQGTFLNVNIRGLGDSNSSDPNTTVGVAIYRDGLLQPEAVLQNEQLFDLADVEVLRGPQGTFVGQNSTGGALFINSADPNLNGVSGYAELQTGNFGDARGDGAINLPVNDTMAMRIAFNLERRDSFFKDVNPDASASGFAPGNLQEQDLRVGFLWQPNDQFESVAKIEYAEIDSDGTTPKPIPGTEYYADAPTEPYTLNYDRTNLQFDETILRLSLRNQIHFAPDGLTLKSLTSYQYGDIRRGDDNDASSVDASYDVGEVHNIRYLGQEFDLLSADSDTLSWVAGATYFHRNTPSRLNEYTASAPFTPADPFAVIIRVGTQTSAEGLFGQFTYHIAPTVQLEVGARYSFEQHEETGSIHAGPITIPTTGSFDTSVPTGKVNLSWTPVPDQYFYTFAARGFKAGGVNNAVSTFGNETVNDYEAGWKSTLFGGKLKTQLGGYYMQYRGLQVSAIDPLTGESTAVRNVGGATIKGIEFSGQAKFGPVGVDGAFAYNRTALGSVTLINGQLLPDGGAGTLGPQCGATVTPGCFNYNPYFTNLSGSANTFSPEVTANIGLSYLIPVGAGTLRPLVGASYTDKQYATLFQNTTFSLIPSRTLMNAQLPYQNGLWRVTLYGINVADRTYITGKGGNNEYFGTPRQFGLRVARDF